MKYTKRVPKRQKTTINRNQGIIGDSIEIMMEKLMEGEGIDGIEDRDLVYNDGETKEVNPITNIRSDKMELMLEEKIGEQDYKKRKMKVIKNEENENEEHDKMDSDNNNIEELK